MLPDTRTSIVRVPFSRRRTHLPEVVASTCVTEPCASLDLAQVNNRIKRYLDYYRITLRQNRSAGDSEQIEQTPSTIQYEFTETKHASTDLRARAYTPFHLRSISDLEDLPIDLYFELARHLQPKDLLNLARTSKTLRAILLSKCNRQIWRTALHAVPLLPPCPKDMSEPAYSALLFGDYCSCCGYCGAYSVDYLLRLRLCGRCYEEKVVSGIEVEVLRDSPAAVRDVVMMSLPCQTRTDTFCRGADHNDIDPLSHMIEDHFFKPELLAMLQSLSDPTEPPEQYIVAQTERVRQRYLDAVEMYGWESWVVKFNRDDSQRSYARKCIWSPDRDEGGVCQPLKLSPELISQELTDLWLMPLLSAKSLSDIKEEGMRRNSRVRDAYKERLKRRKSQLSDWAEKMLAHHPRFREVDPDLFPSKAHLGQMLAIHAAKDNARRSLDALLELNPEVETAESLTILDSLDRRVQDYLRRSSATAALQVHREVGRDQWRSFERQEVDRVMQRWNAFSPLLQRPDALFHCVECSEPRAHPPRPWREVHAHFRKEHPDLLGLQESNPQAPYSSIRTGIRQWPGAFLAQDIVAQLGIGRDNTLTSLSDLAASGQLTCTCGAPDDIEADDNVPLDWPTFVFHVWDRHWNNWRSCVKLRSETPGSGPSIEPAGCEGSSKPQEGVVDALSKEWSDVAERVA